MSLLCTLGQLYLLAIFVRIILSWFPPSQPGGALDRATGVLYSITEPVLGPVRRMLPPVRLGAMGLDLSPIVVIFGLQFLIVAIGC